MERINYQELGQPVGPYVHAVKHHDTLYLSGITAFGTQSQNANIEEQAVEIFRQIEAIAKAEGTTLKNIIKVTVFVTELDRVLELRDTLFNVYGSYLPASSLVKVASLFSDQLKIEIEAILALGDG